MERKLSRSEPPLERKLSRSEPPVTAEKLSRSGQPKERKLSRSEPPLETENLSIRIDVGKQKGETERLNPKTTKRPPQDDDAAASHDDDGTATESCDLSRSQAEAKPTEAPTGRRNSLSRNVHGRLIPQDRGVKPAMGLVRAASPPEHKARIWGTRERTGRRKGNRRGARCGLGAPPAPYPTNPTRLSRMPPGPEACRCTLAQNDEGD